MPEKHEPRSHIFISHHTLVELFWDGSAYRYLIVPVLLERFSYGCGGFPSLEAAHKAATEEISICASESLDLAICRTSRPAQVFIRRCNLQACHWHDTLLVNAPDDDTTLALTNLRSRRRDLLEVAKDLGLNQVEVFCKGKSHLRYDSADKFAYLNRKEGES